MLLPCLDVKAFIEGVLEYVLHFLPEIGYLTVLLSWEAALEDA